MKRIALVLVFLTLALPGWSATLYMGSGEAYTTLRSACAAMNANDVLIIRDGTYSGTNNVLTQDYLPPNGTGGNYTRITSEHIGGAIFPDGFCVFTSTESHAYISFEGLRSNNGDYISGVNHFKYKNCAFTYEADGENAAVTARSSTYVLYEDCWAWGGGRYKFLVYSPNLGDANHVVYRRCVVRFDRVNASAEPAGGFANYRSTYVAYQNCIVVDGDQTEYWSYTGSNTDGGAFYMPWGPQNAYYDGCIILNHNMYSIGGLPSSGVSINNCVMWHNGLGVMVKGDGGGAGTVTRCTIGDMVSWAAGEMHGAYGYSTSSGQFPITNSIFYDCYTGITSAEFTSNYNLLYANSTADFSGITDGANDYCAANSNAKDPIDGNPGNGNPSLLYLPRIETGGDCDGTGSSGSDRGANILYKIGIDETQYGDSGWNTVTENSLWPFPNENQIKSDMQAYSYDSGGLSGDRGFASSTAKQLDGVTPVTLTSYIWEYLGNQMPSDIYGEGDTTPTISGCVQSGGVTR